jgi:hypothetical protein
MQVQIKSQPKPILEGELFAEIKEEDSTWSIGTLASLTDLPPVFAKLFYR